MDVAFPGSKFILTDRDVNAWYKSCLNHFYEDSTAIRDFMYGDGRPKDNEAKFKSVYLESVHKVRLLRYSHLKNQSFTTVNS